MNEKKNDQVPAQTPTEGQPRPAYEAPKMFAIGDASDLLRATLRGGGDRAAAETAARFDVPADRVRADLAGFLADLARRGLVVRGGPGGKSSGRRAATAAAVGVMWAARLAFRLIGT